MALDKLIDSSRLDGALESTADAIRAKTGEEGLLTWDMDTGFSVAVGEIVAVPDLDVQEETVFHPVSGEKTISTPVSVVTVNGAVEDTPIKELEINIDPVQDLHGYDNPWPAGGGKNLFDAEHPSVTYSSGVNYVYNADGSFTLSGTANSNATLFFFVLPYEIPSGSYVTWSLNNSSTNSEVGVRLVRRESGSIANWGTAAYADSVNKTLTVTPTGYNANEINVFVKTNHGAVSEITLKIQCEMGQTVTDWAPYANICPISGWTQSKITRAGKNLFPLYTGTPTTSRDITFTYNSDGSITVSGANTTPSSSSLSTTLLRGMRILKPGTYKKEARTNGFYTYVQYVESSSSWKTVPGGGSTSDEFEITQEIYDNYEIIIRVGVSGGTSYNSATTFYPYIYRDNETDFTWASPARNTYEITFPNEAGTVYGGTLTVNKDGTGKLVADMASVDMGTLTWEYDSAYTRMYANIVGMKLMPTRTMELVCSMYRTISDGRAIENVPNNSIYNGSFQNRTAIFYIKTDQYTDPTAFKTAVTGQTVVYELATPVEIDLTELEVIETLNGVNNIWANTGKINKLTYITTEDVEIIDAEKYTIGKQYLSRVFSKNLLPENIKNGVNVKIGDTSDDDCIASVTGSFTNASTVSSGQIAADTTKIRSGYSAWVNGEEVQGSLANTSIAQGITTINETIASRGIASWGNGVISSGIMSAATFGNEATSGHTYVDISDTTSAPVLVAGDYLYINKGYTDDLKISLAKLVPNGSDVKGHGEYILLGHSAYDNDGTLVAGTIPTIASTDLVVSGRTVTVPVGKYTGASGATAVSASVADGDYTPSVSSQGTNTAAAFTPSTSGTITDIATATKPTGTDGTDYWTIMPSGSKTTGKARAKATATIGTAGYIAMGSKTTSSYTTWDITTNINAGTARYISKGTITNNTSGGTSTDTINRGSQIKVGAGYYPNDLYYTAQANNGNLYITTNDSANTLISCDGYANVRVVGVTVLDGNDFPIINNGDCTITSGSVTKGNLIVSAYNSSGTAENNKSIVSNGKWVAINATASGTYYGRVTVGAGAYSASVSSHSITTTPVVTGSVTGTITDIGTTTQPSGTDGTNYWTLTPSASVTTIGVSTAKGKATISAAGYLTAGNKESSASTVNITPTVSDGAARYIVKGAVTNNTSGGTSTATVNRGKQIKIGAGYYPSDLYYTAQANSGTKTITSSGTTSVDGYLNASVPSASPTFKGGAVSGTATASSSTGASLSTSTNNSGVTIAAAASATRAVVQYNAAVNGWVTAAESADAYAASSATALTGTTYYLNGVTLTAPSSGVRTFSVTVPNGATTANFVFNVDASGNVTITES